MDNLGVISKVYKEFSYEIKNLKFDFKNLTKLDLLDAISSQLNLTFHEQKHLYDALMKKKDLKVNFEEIISFLVSSSNPYIHSLNDISIIEELTYKLLRIAEMEMIFEESDVNQSFFEKIEKENLILDLSNFNSPIVKNVLNLLILQEISSSQNLTDLNIIINSSEGISFINVDKLYIDFIKKILEKLSLNENRICLTLRFADINHIFYQFFDHIIIFNVNTGNLLNKALNLGKELILSRGEIVEFPKIGLPYHIYDSLNKTSKQAQHTIKRRSYLEVEYKDLSDIVANFLIEIEKNMINRKEAKNYLISLGYFSDKIDNLIDKLLKNDLLEEKIIGGVKKLMVTPKGLFFAKQHKMLKND